MIRAFLGLGANLGNREANLRMALRLLATRCRVVAVSSLYRSRAVVPAGAGPGPDYFNAVCAIETDLQPGALLAFCKAIEHEIGRRPGERWAPRPIDIDLLLHGDAIIDEPELTVPHPRIAERAFVLLPLAELAPDAALPGSGTPIAKMAEACDVSGIEHVAGPEWAEATG